MSFLKNILKIFSKKKTEDKTTQPNEQKNKENELIEPEEPELQQSKPKSAFDQDLQSRSEKTYTGN